jgi:GDPmannose 4,6-dehydratase
VSRRRALITGVAGQDGSYLAERLVAEGAEVVGVVRPPAGRELPNLAAVRDRIELVEVDLADAPGLDAAIRAVEPDELYHLAAPTFVPASWEAPRGTLELIAGATATALLAAHATGARIVVPSSPEIFGHPPVSPQDEETPQRPASPYGVAKLAAHELVRVLRERFDLHASAVITYNHESPRRPSRFVTRRITQGVAAIVRGEADEIVLGDLEAVRDWSHARDVVDGMVAALRHPQPGDYVLASGVGRTVREFAEAAFAAGGVAPAVRVDPELVRPREPVPLVGDASRAHTTLGWRPVIAFDTLVREMVAADLG